MAHKAAGCADVSADSLALSAARALLTYRYLAPYILITFLYSIEALTRSRPVRFGRTEHASVLARASRLPRQASRTGPAPSHPPPSLSCSKTPGSRFGWSSNIFHERGQQPLVGQQRLPCWFQETDKPPILMWSGIVIAQSVQAVTSRVELNNTASRRFFSSKLPVTRLTCNLSHALVWPPRKSGWLRD